MKRLPSLDSLYSDKPLGCLVENGKTTFRVFAPRATEVKLALFDKAEDETGKEILMKRDADGVWEHVEQGELYGKFYGYKVNGALGKGEMWNPNVVVADPYSKAVATKNTYRHEAKTLILDTRYDWEGDTWVIPKNHNELVIYEAHARDLTAHASSGVEKKGTYLGLVEKGKTGGLDYLKSLGVNAIELLPIHKFGTIEIPYRDSSVLREGYPLNTWNPYERNHWGYMTSYFFAPETYYATDGTLDPKKMNGTDGRAVREFKDMVKALHREGIAVILDVVYNHVSQYDYNCFKYIDKFYYFRTDSAGNFLSLSGCGNDFKTERPMARRLIVESVKYWMTEYHIDGFRFDLAAMIDFETAKEIYKEAKKINPNVILIAEAWGGGEYEPHLFSDIGWASWNDQIRNGVKGQNPDNGLGFIFGKFQGRNNVRSLRSFITGTLREDGGLFRQKEHSINYLESHDDHTLGDFIRLGLRDVKRDDVIKDLDQHAKLTPKQLALNKLAALFLFVSQGPIMIHEGQEFARSKVIAPTDAPDKNVGKIDHNSYEKDNETNYLNYHHAKLNAELVDYYKGLIALRKASPIFSSAPKSAVKFIDAKDTLVVAFRLDKAEYNQNADKKSEFDFLVVMNGHPRKATDFVLPEGEWQIVANEKKVSPLEPLGTAKGRIAIPASSGLILRQ
ncbi:MAG: alpha-amylase family glycosyl hydrolase [Chloroherpetonaceae bacterium]|nr:alpha-amylase family glycosyl hydrolase [Chloroherpetonaceae bacterium]MDW8436896.1 alpha-amylase family glycosyl hydrolase [Chloroherpetonaceae bacterium]